MYQLYGRLLSDTLLSDLALAVRMLDIDERPQGYGCSWPEPTIDLCYPIMKDHFPGEWTFAMFSIVHPAGHIPGHEEGTTISSGATRYHLIVQTNPRVWIYHDDVWQQLEQGSIYTMLPQKFHGAVNYGMKDRIHFVVDTRI